MVLEPGEYVVVPRTTGCNLRKPDSQRSDPLPSLLTPSGDLHPLATLALHDLFRRLDTLTLDGTLSLAELTTFFTRLSLPFTQDTYHALLRAHCPGHSEHGLDRRAFCEWWRQEALIRGEASDVMRWLEAWGYTRGEAWPCEARCVMVSMQSMDPVAVRIGTERGEDALVSVMVNQAAGTVVEGKDGEYCLRQKFYPSSYSFTFTIENLSPRTCEFTLDLSGSRNLLFSEPLGKVTKLISPGSSDFMMHAEATPGAEEIARVAKVTYKEFY